MLRRSLLVGLALTQTIATNLGAQQLDERVLPREVADEVLRLWNAPGTLRVTGPYLVEASREVSGDIAVLGGDLTIAGHVSGRIVSINADVRLSSGARVDGDILAVGGQVTGSDVATVGGQIRVYRARLDYTRDGDRLTRGRDETDDTQRWWRRRERWRSGGWSDLRLVSARTYNRVEGLPVFIGPSVGRKTGVGRLTIDAYGVLRSAEGFKWKPDNVGHSLKTELQLGERGGLRVGARLFDVVDAVEPWHLSDPEVGLAAVVLHRDFRDYYNRHGGSVYASLYRGKDVDFNLSYSDQRWAARPTRDPWTLFRNEDPWRDNPAMDEGNLHLLNATARYDTRNDPSNPLSGWYLVADYEYGTGVIDRYAATSPGVRDQSLTGETSYDRLFVDLRRYNRISPDAQLNVRVVAGGWLSGDDLPLQRRFSVGGPGTLGGYDFRRTLGPTDVWQCSTPQRTTSSLARPRGRPAQCERFAMVQAEFRGDLHVDPFGVLDEERDRRRAGWGRGTQWVLFADAGRGWLVGVPDQHLFYRSDAFPQLSTFRTDVGVGLVLDNVGVYASKSVSDGKAPINIFVRLQPRF